MVNGKLAREWAATSGRAPPQGAKNSMIQGS